MDLTQCVCIRDSASHQSAQGHRRPEASLDTTAFMPFFVHCIKAMHNVIPAHGQQSLVRLAAAAAFNVAEMQTPDLATHMATSYVAHKTDPLR